MKSEADVEELKQHWPEVGGALPKWPWLFEGGAGPKWVGSRTESGEPKRLRP